MPVIKVDTEFRFRPKLELEIHPLVRLRPNACLPFRPRFRLQPKTATAETHIIGFGQSRRGQLRRLLAGTCPCAGRALRNDADRFAVGCSVCESIGAAVMMQYMAGFMTYGSVMTHMK